MRLVTFGQNGKERVGVVQGSEVVDVTAAAPTMLALIQAGSAGRESVRRELEKGARLALNSVTLRSPIPRPAKNVICIGRNYKEHVAETGASLPSEPIWFTKAVTAICGPYDDIALDLSISRDFDWEVELALVIGREGRHIGKDHALDYVHSYAVFNDFSVRDIQNGRRQWFLGKSYEKSAPLGPWLITPDELGDPQSLNVRCRVNGIVKQESNTSLMIFDIATCIADISRIMTLEPGDIISTGTPSGVGFSRNPPEFLKPGDVMETEIDGIGTLRNRLVSAG